MSEFIDKASLERDEFERNSPPFTLDFEMVGLEKFKGDVVQGCEEEVEIESFGVFELEGDVEHEGSSFEDSMIDFHALISDVRPCGEGVATPLPISHTPFS